MLARKILIGAVCLAVATALGSEKNSNGPTTKDQVKKDVTTATQTTGTYLNQQKDAAIAKAKEEYTEMQRKTQTFLSDLKNKSQQKWEQVKPEIQAKLDSVQQHLDKMDKAADKAFDKAQKSFDDAMNDLKKIFEKAKSSETAKSAPAASEKSK
jgi:hypothetical protein